MLGAEIELMPNEKMILASNPHWFYFWKQVAAGLGIIGLLLLLALVEADWLNSVVRWALLAAVVVLVLDLIFEFVQWKTTRFAITDQRVAYQSGIFRRSGVSIPLNRINNVNFNQTLIARMLNNGVVTIESAGQTGDSVFENIPDPERVRTVIFAQVEADEQRDSDRDAESLAKAIAEKQVGTTPAAGGSTLQERLAALDELRAQGLVTDEEYQLKRQQILDSL
ncbi:MAG TPA: PH domain-containing protein [Ilumatobacteraceae bacterium]|nr:PH domain-containing protein [Ilumatobacteraceae bacterium]